MSLIRKIKSLVTGPNTDINKDIAIIGKDNSPTIKRYIEHDHHVAQREHPIRGKL